MLPLDALSNSSSLEEEFSFLSLHSSSPLYSENGSFTPRSPRFESKQAAVNLISPSPRNRTAQSHENQLLSVLVEWKVWMERTYDAATLEWLPLWQQSKTVASTSNTEAISLIVYNEDEHGSIRAGTLSALVHQLLNYQHKSSNFFVEFRDVFFSTLSFFCSELELLQQFYEHQIMLENCSSAKLEEHQISVQQWEEMYDQVILFWIENYFEEWNHMTKYLICCWIIESYENWRNCVEVNEAFYLTMHRIVVKLIHSFSEKITSNNGKRVYPIALEWEMKVEEVLNLRLLEEQHHQELNKEEEEDSEEETEEEEDEDEIGEEDIKQFQQESYQSTLQDVLQLDSLYPPQQQVDILTIPSRIIAQQYCIIDMQMMQNIKLHECLGNRFSKEKMESQAPHIAAIIQQFNKTSVFFSNLILSQENIEKRASVLSKCIDIVEELIVLNNFQTAMAICGTLNSNPIRRLTKSWNLLEEREVEACQVLEELLCAVKKFKNLRNAMDNIKSPPCIPYLGILLSDLATIEATNRDYLELELQQGQSEPTVLSSQQQSLEAHKAIHFNKCRLYAKILGNFQTYQKFCTYPYVKVRWLNQYLKHDCFVDIPSEQVLSQKSFAIQPRGVK